MSSPTSTGASAAALPAPPPPAAPGTAPAPVRPASLEAPPAVRDADLFYGDEQTIAKSYRPSFLSAANETAHALGWTPEQRDEHITETAVFCREAHIPSDEATGLHAILAHHLAAPADDATRREWATEARRRLHDTYGADAPTRLAAMQAYVRARPALARQMNATGVGSHPAWVMALAARAHRMTNPRQG